MLRLNPLPKARRPKATDGSDRRAARLAGARLNMSGGRGAADAVDRPFGFAAFHPGDDMPGVQGLAPAVPALGNS
jgi:hypothetical protein